MDDIYCLAGERDISRLSTGVKESYFAKSKSRRPSAPSSGSIMNPCLLQLRKSMCISTIRMGWKFIV